MAADRAAELDVPLAELSPATVAKLQAALPPNWSHGNPVDLIGDAGPERYRAALEACIADPGIDGVVAILTPQAMTDADEAAHAVIAAAAPRRKPVIACWMGQASVSAARKAMRAAGVPVYRLPEPAVEAWAYMAQYRHNQQALLEVPAPLEHREPPDLRAARAVVEAALAENRTLLTATESKRFLGAFRIPVVPCEDAATVEAAVAAAEATGYPVVMKVLSRDITHKSDVGGVKLGLADAAAVRAAWNEIMASVAREKPQARVQGVSIERMVVKPHARELMIGVTTDRVFGPAITFGAGGIAVEVLRDRVVGLPPLNSVLVHDMVRGTRVGRMLERFRNLPAIDAAALEAAMLRVSELACEMPELAELDINPLIADEHGVLAIDARVVVRRPAPGLPRYGHLAIHPYPAELESEMELKGGEKVLVRPIRPEDAAMEIAFVESLSPETRRLRFQSALRSLTPTMLARFTQIDYDREMALVAIDSTAEAGREVAVCRYVRMPDGVTCEFAVVVADSWQGKGLGSRLMRRLAEIAAGRGLERMVGFVLAENANMIAMCQHLGMRIEPEDDGLTRRAVLDLVAAR
jgi:acetyltransferase